MGLYDDLRPQLEEGPETWADRVRAEIGFTSPDGEIFTGKWIEDSRSKLKRLQLTDYLEKKYTKARDLGIASTTHPITFYFDGNDCDVVSQKFWEKCDESGEWEIIHPVNGFKSYQLVSVTQKNAYVSSGGVVEFVTEWIEPQDFNPTESGRKLKSIADHHRAVLKENSALSFAEKLKLGTDALRKHTENVSKKVAGISSKTLGPIAALNDFAYESFLDSSRMIRDIKLATEFQGRMLAGQLQNLLSIAVKATTDPFVRNAAYNKMIDNVSGDGFTVSGSGYGVSVSSDVFGLNKVLTFQLVTESCIDALCEIATTSEIETIESGTDIISNLMGKFYFVAEQFDIVQSELSSGTNADSGFVCFETTINDIENAISSAVKYVIYQMSKAKIKKSVVVDSNISTIRFFIKHSKKLNGFFDFCDKNRLSGSDIFMLRKGMALQV